MYTYIEYIECIMQNLAYYTKQLKKKKKKNSADEQLSEIIFLSCYNKQWLHP